MPHLINESILNNDVLTHLFELTDHYQASIIEKHARGNKHTGLTACNLFFENSTRTCNSFQLAQMRHDMLILTPTLAQSALSKGESLNDMVQNLQAMGSRLFVVRHQEHDTVTQIAHCLNDESRLINAGSGSDHHPSQAVLDLYTIQQYKPNFADLSVAIVGDSLHSRVAHSLVPLLKQLGVSDIRLIAPPELLANDLLGQGANHHISMREGLKQVDIIYCLRIQKERIDKRKHPSDDTFHSQFGLSEKLLPFAKSDAIVMHPGPMNREVEIASTVADGPQSVILKQVEYSIPMRMALIDYVMSDCHGAA